MALHLGSSSLAAYLDIDHDLFAPARPGNYDWPYGLGAALNLGNEWLGLSLQGGVRGAGAFLGELYTPSAGAQLVGNLWGVELATDLHECLTSTVPRQARRIGRQQTPVLLGDCGTDPLVLP